MNKTYHPAIRNGKPVLVEETNKKKPDYTKYDVGADYMKDLADYEKHLASLEVLEVSKELLEAMPKWWCWDWAFYGSRNLIEEGYTGVEILVEGVDFNITSPFHLEGTQRVQRLVAIPLPGVIQEKEHSDFLWQEVYLIITQPNKTGSTLYEELNSKYIISRKQIKNNG